MHSGFGKSPARDALNINILTSLSIDGDRGRYFVVH